MVRRKQSHPVAKRRGEDCGEEDVRNGTDSTRQGLVDRIWSLAKKLEEGKLENGEWNLNTRKSEERKRKKRKKTGNEIDEFLLEIPSNVVNKPWLVGIAEGQVDQSLFDNDEDGDVGKGVREWRCSFTTDGGGKEGLCLRDASKSSILVQGPSARDLVGLLRSGYVSLSKIEGDFEETTRGVALFGVHLEEKGFRDLKLYPEDAKGKPGSRQLLQVLKWLRPQVVETNDSSEENKDERYSCDAEHLIVSRAEDTEDIELDASGLYGLIRPTGKEKAFTGALRELKPTLHGYQKRAVQWMIDRENSSDTFKGCQNGANHLLWREVRCLRGDSPWCEAEEEIFYINAFNGVIRKEMPDIPEKPRGIVVSRNTVYQ